jgi:hypothetical protein
MQLNEVQLSLLTDQQRDRYNKLESLFEHPGWKIVQEFAETSAAAQSQRALEAPNWDQHRLATGARVAFTQIAQLPLVTENEFANLAAQQAQAQEDAEEDEISLLE